ncbi:hypothetical protein RRG08_020660 [Elysia crispata]|uniref:Uncharacterized protein n=1 Tax=Elysia crispata TaxID=231223 RepID=A0AAE0Z5S0_9GAST|nr:hypothetical protein RRG08_020660 [Elysia crispata]
MTSNLAWCSCREENTSPAPRLVLFPQIRLRLLSQSETQMYLDQEIYWTSKWTLRGTDQSVMTLSDVQLADTPIRLRPLVRAGNQLDCVRHDVLKCKTSQLRHTGCSGIMNGQQITQQVTLSTEYEKLPGSITELTLGWDEWIPSNQRELRPPSENN